MGAAVIWERDVEDAVPYGHERTTDNTVGAGVPDRPRGRHPERNFYFPQGDKL